MSEGLEHFKNQIPDTADAEERVILPKFEKSNVISINREEQEEGSNPLTAADYEADAMKDVQAAREQEKKDAAEILALRAKLKMDVEPLKEAA